MSRLAADLHYVVRTSLRGLRASSVTTAVSVGTIAVALVLVGAFALLVANMEGLLDRFGDDLRVTAYLEEGVSEDERGELAALASTVEGVLEVQSISSAQALARFREGVGARTGLLEALDENPLPASLEITLVEERRSPDGMRVVVEALDGLPGVAELAYGQEWVEGYARSVALLRNLGLGLGCVLGLATLLIVTNTIRLAVYARRDELEILSLVGAGRGFVATPFLLEGALVGGLGGLVALAILLALFRLLLPSLEEGLALLVGFASPRFFRFGEALSLVNGGVGLGLVGSALALVRGHRD